MSHESSFRKKPRWWHCYDIKNYVVNFYAFSPSNLSRTPCYWCLPCVFLFFCATHFDKAREDKKWKENSADFFSIKIFFSLFVILSRALMRDGTDEHKKHEHKIISAWPDRADGWREGTSEEAKRLKDRKFASVGNEFHLITTLILVLRLS